MGKPTSLEAKGWGDPVCAFDSRRLRQNHFRSAKASAPTASTPRP